MSFHRFEDNALGKGFTPHLSTAKNHLVEGDYLYYNLNTKAAGTGSEPHYHPNELLVFCVRGRINALVGKERHVITPGTFVVVPPCARHSFKATEDGDCAYLYIKDQTWTLVGIAEDEALPEKAMSVEDAHKMHDAGQWPGQKNTAGESSAIIEGFASCFYPILSSLEEPIGQIDRQIVLSGTLIDFGFYEFPRKFEMSEDKSAHERFIYVLAGSAEATVDGDTKQLTVGDIVKMPKGSAYRISQSDSEGGVRFTMHSSNSLMEKMVDEQAKSAG